MVIDNMPGFLYDEKRETIMKLQNTIVIQIIKHAND